MARSNGTKKSLFPASTTIPADATFDFVSGGANYKITTSNLVTGLGVTGTIVATGLGTDTPVLDHSGTIYGIRNINGGFGITTSVDANNSVSIATSMTFDNTGAAIVNDPTASSPAFRSLVAGDGITLAESTGEIKITNNSPYLSNSIVIKTLADFPTPVLSVITLAANTVYLIDGNINVAGNGFVLSENTTILGFGDAASSITSSTTGNLFTATKNFVINNLNISAASATIFSCTGSASETAFLNHFHITTASSIGTFTTWHSLNWQYGRVSTVTSPLSMVGACNSILMDEINFIAGYTTAINLGTATFDFASINQCRFQNASATNHIIVAASGGNINAGNIGTIFENTFNASATNIVNGWTSGDLQWYANANSNLGTTTRNAQMYMHTTSTTTIGSGSGDNGNPIKISAGTNWVSAHADQFTVNTNGRITYNGINTAEFVIDCKISGTVAAGTSTFTFYLAKNGSIITSSKSTEEFSSSAIGSASSVCSIVSLVATDYIEVFVENDTDLDDWVSHTLNMTAGSA